MQINHNIRAMITQNSLFQNNNAMSKSLEKLSTGLRINRAQDDAAGLAMSEQMRNQIRSMGKAKQNSQDGQAALQIAEGALGEIDAMLKRQKELAIQSANDTLTSTERKYLNDEFQALTKEIDRIALTTDYNGKNVLVYNADPNKSFGAVKSTASYDLEELKQDAVDLVRRIFGVDMQNGLDTISTGGNGTTAGDAATQIAAVNTEIAAINAAAAKFGGATTSAIGDILTTILAATDEFSNAGLLVNPQTFQGSAGAIWAGTTMNGITGNGTGGTTPWSSADLETIQKISAFIEEARTLSDKIAAATIFGADKNANAVELFDKALNFFGTGWGESAATGAAGIDLLGGTSAGANYSLLKDAIALVNSAATTISGAYGARTTAAMDAAGAAYLNTYFGSGMSKAMQEAIDLIMNYDVNVMTNTAATHATASSAPNAAAIELYKDQRVVLDWQRNLGLMMEAADYLSAGKAGSEVLHVGANYSQGLGGPTANEINVNYVSISTKDLGIAKQNIESQTGATAAIDKLDKVIKEVSGSRAKIGTYINRLDYTISNISSLEYNTQDAESRIRDTDFAKETTNFTRNQIMVQASTSMLSQANALPQSVLSLIG